MFGLFDWLKIGVGATVGAVVAYNVGHWRGDDAGYVRAQDEARARALELIQKRSEDNAEISDLDMRGLCLELGGIWVQSDNRCD